jgi:Swt1-like HEPN
MPSNRHHAAELLRRGLPPSKIAREMKIPVGVVMAYLYRQVGEGELRRSDILFTLDIRAREQIENLVQQRASTVGWRLRRWLKAAGVEVDPDDLDIYLKLRDARVDLGDMYELIRDLELSLHRFIREQLELQYGQDWWREGIPLHVREDCAVLNERDQEPAVDLFCYTTIIHLLKIFDQNWNALSPQLPGPLRANKQAFLARLKRLNAVRNIVMHPVKALPLTEDDFYFLRRFHADFAPALHPMQTPPAAPENQPPHDASTAAD